MRCTIQWIDCSGNPTPDTNEAVGIAVSTIAFRTGEPQVKRFPICAAHLESMGQSHHNLRGGCHHASRPPNPESLIVSSKWTLEPLPAGGTGAGGVSSPAPRVLAGGGG